MIPIASSSISGDQYLLHSVKIYKDFIHVVPNLMCVVLFYPCSSKLDVCGAIDGNFRFATNKPNHEKKDPRIV